MHDPGGALRDYVNFNLEQQVDKPAAPRLQETLKFAILEVQAFFIGTNFCCFN